jgi:membrane protease YdiL (CAAX protease family)
MRPRAYGAHDALIVGLQPNWRIMWLLAGLAVIAAVALALNMATFTLLDSIAPQLLARLALGGGGPMGAGPELFLLGTYGFVSLGVFAAVVLVDRRRFVALIGGYRLFWQLFRRSFVALGTLFLIVLALPPWGMGDPLIPNLPVDRWLILLPVSVAVIFVQVSAEEFLFRGYIQQSLAARFKNPLIWLLLPSILFGIAHYAPAEAGENAVIIVIWSGLFGLAAADLTARTGSLGPAVALHFVNNLSALLIFSMPDGLSGLALYLTPFGMDDVDQLPAWLVVDLIMTLASWLTLRLALRV